MDGPHSIIVIRHILKSLVQGLQMDNGLLDEIKIEPISEERIESYHQCLDSVARERLHLAFVEAPPLNSTRDFVISNITRDVPQLVAVRGDEVVGWCGNSLVH